MAQIGTRNYSHQSLLNKPKGLIIEHIFLTMKVVSRSKKPVNIICVSAATFVPVRFIEIGRWMGQPETMKSFWAFRDFLLIPKVMSAFLIWMAAWNKLMYNLHTNLHRFSFIKRVFLWIFISSTFSRENSHYSQESRQIKLIYLGKIWFLIMIFLIGAGAH